MLVLDRQDGFDQVTRNCVELDQPALFPTIGVERSQALGFENRRLDPARTLLAKLHDLTGSARL
jgi:hypothetical protein